ncbi:phosphoglycerate mutase-like protein [Multifurca ochricompacta]|uniref:Phosphoglycerate mutase-like protein n=1 Tax=Multifurca ochricompacta TaxID=376703 RepID=A0AAD4LXJ5_9AGAM|nr:phosphoglycerate mutase-like protein [Multifurca ochricompacta]
MQLIFQNLAFALPLASSVVTAQNPGLGLSSASGVYNSSETPSMLPWNTYNFCNAPHINALHYAPPPLAVSAAGQLVHVSVVMRHHKRTPDNLAPSERALNPPMGWDCSKAVQLTYDLGGVAIAHDATTPAQHPFARTIWSGTCDAGQLTSGGLIDAAQHGKDLWELYHDHLGFLSVVSPEEIWVRTSTEDRTMQVAGAMLAAMDPLRAARGQPWAVHTQPSSIDSLVPAYPCPAANSIRDAFQAVPAWTDHLSSNVSLKARLDDAFGTADIGSWASWYDHFFDALTARTCNGHPLPCNDFAGTKCVSEADAAAVFAIGDFEYDYIWHAAENASTYNSLTFGAFFAELADALAVPEFSHRLALYVGHDGSLVRLLAGLGVVPLRWPSFGAEVVFEVWEVVGTRFVRVFHEGTVIKGMEWIPLEEFVGTLRLLVPDQLFERCMGD